MSLFIRVVLIVFLGLAAAAAVGEPLPNLVNPTLVPTACQGASCNPTAPLFRPQTVEFGWRPNRQAAPKTCRFSQEYICREVADLMKKKPDSAVTFKPSAFCYLYPGECDWACWRVLGKLDGCAARYISDGCDNAQCPSSFICNRCGIA
eukprot:gnl/Spiro4/8174_TR4307_c0_g1_i1.p1 gnl/Spiro4/8174_TR4307_c0_g1~~gnl/Spiro4/8174_TR4307_c0_g1_i1.p1  ORF type:complete len:149 (+),score=47.26 gnl/Spiro4/8174_TR4307_c0_g1_i1:57-503(+)